MAAFISTINQKIFKTKTQHLDFLQCLIGAKLTEKGKGLEPSTFSYNTAIFVLDFLESYFIYNYLLFHVFSQIFVPSAKLFNARCMSFQKII